MLLMHVPATNPKRVDISRPLSDKRVTTLAHGAAWNAESATESCRPAVALDLIAAWRHREHIARPKQITVAGVTKLLLTGVTHIVTHSCY